MVHWGSSGENKTRVTFLVPDVVKNASVVTSDGVSHKVPIVNNTGDIVVKEANVPRLVWSDQTDKQYKMNLDSGAPNAEKKTQQ